ncbi:unnamed protein product [Urochloa decumbens]|uniref:Uncharacterized protein n=1 Tax=Urochloa decumbens TaxID=240449 RepID=A0ABC9AW14_9POAL
MPLLIKSNNKGIMYFTTIVFLVLAMTSSTFASCHAGNNTWTCYIYPGCDLKGCANHCEHMGKKSEGCQCITECADPSECCCKD